MPEITLPVQKAEKVIKPPVKSLQLGDGYEQTFQNAIADVEEWNVTTPPMDDADANSLEDLLNGLNGDPFTWTPPYSDPGTYRLNSKITRTMVSYMRSTLQFSLKRSSNLRSFDYAPRFLKVYFTNPNHATNGYSEAEIKYSGPTGGYDTPFSVDGFWDALVSPNQGIAWKGPIINNEQVAGGFSQGTGSFYDWGFFYRSYNGIAIYQVDHYERVVLVPEQINFFIQLPAINLSSIDSVKDKETGFVYSLNTHYTANLVEGGVNIIPNTAIADSTGLEIRYRV